MKENIRKAIIVFILVVVWEAVARSNIYPEILFPAASSIFIQFAKSILSGELIGYAQTSLTVLSISLALGIVIGLTLSVLAVLNVWTANFLETVTTLLAPLPSIAILPVAILWFGIGWKPIIFVILHAVIWPLSLNTYAGFRAIPKVYNEIGRNIGMRGLSLITKVQIPAAFPYLITGLKISWAYAWRTAVAAEMVFGVAGSQGGLGWFIYEQRYALNTASVFAGMLTVMIIGLVVEEIGFKFLERKTIKKWGMST